MHTMRVTCKQGDTPTITYTFTDSDGNELDLSSNGPYGAPERVRTYISEKKSGVLVANRDATIINAATGEIEITLEQAETALEGVHQVEFEAIWSNQDTTNLTSPSDGYVGLLVKSAVGSVNASTVANTTLSGPIDAGGNDITNGGRFAANTLEASLIEDSDTGELYDIGSLGSGFPSVSGIGTTVVSAASDINFRADGDATVQVSDDGDSTVTVEYSASGGTGDRVDITDNTTTVAEPSIITFTGSNAASVNVTDDGDGTATVDISASSSGSLSLADKRELAYQNGPSVTIESSRVDSASKTGSTAEYGEVSVPLRDGYRLEVIEAGAGDDDASATSEAQIIVATDADDTGTYTQIYSTPDTDAVPEDGNGNIDFTSTLVTHDNTTGSLNRVFFRAVNTDSGESTIAVWGNFTILRRPIP